MRWLLVLAGLFTPTVVTYDLFTNKDCSSIPEPHFSAGFMVAAAAGVMAFIAVIAHRGIVGWMARRVRVRSRPAGIALSAATLMVPTLLGFASTYLAAWLYMKYAFHLCFMLR